MNIRGSIMRPSARLKALRVKALRVRPRLGAIQRRLRVYRTEITSTTSGSLLYRLFVARPRAIAVTGVLLMLLFVSVSYLDGLGILPTGTGPGSWWRNLQFATLSIYMLLVGHFLDSHDTKVVKSFRQMVDIEESAMDRLIAKGAGSRRGDLIVLAIGVAIGSIMSPGWGLPDEHPWTQVYVRSTIVLMYVLVALSIYRSMASSRLFRALYKEPLRLNIFDPAPFKPVAQGSVAIACAFMGAITLSLFFNLYATWLLSFQAIVIYGVSASIAVLLFFNSLLDAHHAMLRVKRGELKVASGHLSSAYRALKDGTIEGQVQGAGPLLESVTIWLAYEKRLKEAPEWPFTGGTLSNLAVSILLPVVVAVMANFLTR